MKKLTIYLFGCFLFVGACCSKQVKQEPRPEPQVEAPKTETKYVEKTVVTSDGCDVCSLVRVTPQTPGEVALGQAYELNATVTALKDACNVVLTTYVTDGASYVKSEPTAAVEGNKLVWMLGALRAGETQNVKLWLKAEREGTVATCFCIAALPGYCTSVNVGKPAINITKTGPAMAQLGESVTYSITVSNTGSSTARDVVVVDEIPQGLEHESGQGTIQFQIGDLNAGDSKQLSVTLKTTQRGRFCNIARANSSNAGSVSAEACTEVKQQQVELVVTCDKDMFVNKSGKSCLTLSNPGDVDLQNVVVTSEWSGNLKFLRSDCEFQKTSETQAVWNVGTLPANGQKQCCVEVISKEPGEYCMKMTVTTAEGLTKTASCCTQWKGFPAVLIEVVDDPDPLLIDEETVFTIRVTNQGTADDTNILIKGVMPEEVDAVQVDGSTAGSIEGKNFSFTPYPVLKPKQVVEWKVKGKATGKGDARIKVYLTSDLLQKPVLEEESTHVY